MHDPAATEGAPITPDAVRNANDLRDLLRQVELGIANLRRGTGEQAADTVRLMHTVQRAIPRLEDQFKIELKAERARLQTLEGALRSNAALVVQKAGASRLQALRREVGADEADWWMHLDQLVAARRSQQLRRVGVRVGVIAVVLVVLAAVYQLFLAPSVEPAGASGHLQRGEDRLTQGRLEQALTEYTAALDAGAEGSDAPIAIGAILTQLGRDAEAQPYLDQARGLLSEADFHASLALLYYKMASQGGLDTVDRAEQAALTALEADDTSAMAYLALGSVYELQGDVGRAIEALSKASSLSTDTALTASIQMRLAMLSQRPPELPTPVEPAAAE